MEARAVLWESTRRHVERGELTRRRWLVHLAVESRIPGAPLTEAMLLGHRHGFIAGPSELRGALQEAAELGLDAVDGVMLAAGAWDEQKHPRRGKGDEGGGQFTSGGEGGGGAAEGEQKPATARGAERAPAPRSVAPREGQRWAVPGPDAFGMTRDDWTLPSSWNVDGEREEVLGKVRREKPLVGIERGATMKQAAREVTTNARRALSQYASRFDGESYGRLRDFVDDTSALFLDAYPGADANAVDAFMRDTIDRLVYQDVRSTERALTDHGVRHITGDIENASNVLDAMQASGIDVTSRDRLLVGLALAHHDYAYTAPAMRETFNNAQHVPWGAQVFARDVEGKLAAIAGEQDASWVTQAIATHSDAFLDWDNEPRLSVVRVADNFSVFAEQKLPNLFRQIPGAMHDMKRMHAAVRAGNDAEFESAKGTLAGRLASADLPQVTKNELSNALRDVTKYTPKVFMGRLAGDLSGFGFTDSDGDGSPEVEVRVKYTSDARVLRDFFDMRQEDFVKFAGDLGVSKEAMASVDQIRAGLPMVRKDGKLVGVIRVSGVDEMERDVRAASLVADAVVGLLSTWSEDEHPRESDGKFAPKGGGGETSRKEEKKGRASSGSRGARKQIAAGNKLSSVVKLREFYDKHGADNDAAMDAEGLSAEDRVVLRTMWGSAEQRAAGAKALRISEDDIPVAGGRPAAERPKDRGPAIGTGVAETDSEYSPPDAIERAKWDKREAKDDATYEANTAALLASGAPRVDSVEVATRLADMMTNPSTEEGFSWSPVGEQPDALGGIMVARSSKEGRSFKIKKGTPREELVAKAVDYIRSSLDYIEANPGRMAFGGWLSKDGNYYVDTSERFDSDDGRRAVYAGRERNQQGVFRFSDFKTIDSGGTGV